MGKGGGDRRRRTAGAAHGKVRGAADLSRPRRERGGGPRAHGTRRASSARCRGRVGAVGVLVAAGGLLRPRGGPAAAPRRAREAGDTLSGRRSRSRYSTPRSPAPAPGAAGSAQWRRILRTKGPHASSGAGGSGTARTPKALSSTAHACAPRLSDTLRRRGVGATVAPTRRPTVLPPS